MGRGRKSLFGSGRIHVAGMKFPPVMYGLQGVRDIFNVSKATASRYVSTFLKDAVTKNGNVIIIDTAKALRAFGVNDPSSFIIDNQ